MEKKYISNPGLLTGFLFSDVSTLNTDSVRTIVFERVLNSLDLKIRVYFTEYISDDPYGTYKQNHQIDFEEIIIIDSSGNKQTTSINTIRDLKKFIELLGDRWKIN